MVLIFAPLWWGKCFSVHFCISRVVCMLVGNHNECVKGQKRGGGGRTCFIEWFMQFVEVYRLFLSQWNSSLVRRSNPYRFLCSLKYFFRGITLRMSLAQTEERAFVCASRNELSLVRICLVFGLPLQAEFVMLLTITFLFGVLLILDPEVVRLWWIRLEINYVAM